MKTSNCGGQRFFQIACSCLSLAIMGGTVMGAGAQEVKCFRVAGPAATKITSVTPSGMLTWSNAATPVTCTIQITTNLGVPGWVDYVQVPVSNRLATIRLFDPHPPAGMVLIPSGIFTMGDGFGEGYDDELPRHSVYVSGFYMDRCKVTKGQWDKVKQWGATNGYSFTGSGRATNHPVQAVTWYDAVRWCNARSQKEGLTPCYYTDAALTTVYKSGPIEPYVKWTANGYRLPTEAEWEKAARGGASGRRFPWRDTDLISHSRANYNAGNFQAYDLSYPAGYHPAFATGGTPYTSPAGYFAPNGYGLYDMAGNTWEWCWDWYQADWYDQIQATQDNTPGPAVPRQYRVQRGGSWNDFAFFARVSYRGGYYPSFADGHDSFRCVRNL